MRFIDTHCHLTAKQFDNIRKGIISESNEHNVSMITCGTDYTTSVQAVELAKQHKAIHAAIGLHPTDGTTQELDSKSFRSLISKEKNYIVAIGEIGIDYYHEHDKAIQFKQINEQFDLANESELPVILHCRGSQEVPDDAFDDLYDILKNNPVRKKGVVHSFTGTNEYAHKFIELGYYLGFNGISTFKNSHDLRALIKGLPLDRILIETDAPYLSPEPKRGQLNKPHHVIHVAEMLENLLDMPLAGIAEHTTQNANKLFNL